jgi:hypothetical protein
MKLILIRLVRIYFGFGAVFGGLGILSYVWGGNSGRLQRFRSCRCGPDLCGLCRGRQNPRLAAVIDPLVVRGTCISAMLSARPFHHPWDFAMTPKRWGPQPASQVDFRRCDRPEAESRSD